MIVMAVVCSVIDCAPWCQFSSGGGQFLLIIVAVDGEYQQRWWWRVLKVRQVPVRVVIGGG